MFQIATWFLTPGFPSFCHALCKVYVSITWYVQVGKSCYITLERVHMHLCCGVKRERDPTTHAHLVYMHVHI